MIGKLAALEARQISDVTSPLCLAILDSAKVPIKVFVMDLWCYTPQYDRYLCESLQGVNIDVTLGSVCPYQDVEYFARHGLRNDPGLLDLVPKLRIPNDTLRRTLMLVESCVNMAALLARFSVSKPDIIHVQWTPLLRKVPFELWLLKFAKGLGIKLVYTVHNLLPHDSGTRFLSLFKHVYNEMDALICHTEEASNSLVHEFSVDPKRIWVIPHGPLLHDLKRDSTQMAKSRLNLPPDVPVVLWQGFIRPYKGLDFLLQAWHKIAAQGLRACLLIVGSGEREMLEDLQEQVTRLNLQESVRLDLRFVPDEELATYYQAADILTYPYRDVTTSGALMTALAYNKPIVATNLPGFREILRDLANALLVNYGDVDALSNSLALLIREPGERRRLAAAITALHDFNNWDRIAKETRQCYATVLRTATSRSVARSHDVASPHAFE
jgi:glycosyltransferase involved in cell wall biosynthesis